MSAIDMATLGILSLAVLLQVLAGLIVFLYTDFNPSRPSRDDPSETDNFQEVPRGESILIDTNSDSDVREVSSEYLEQYSGRNVYIYQMKPGELSEIEFPRSPTQTWPTGGSRELFARWFTRSVRIRRTEGDIGPGDESRVYAPPWRPFNLPLWQMDAFRRLFRQLSLLLLAVAALVRFASGEPILNLF